MQNRPKLDLGKQEVICTPDKKNVGSRLEMGQNGTTMLGKRPSREVIEDFESVYQTYKRQKRSATQ